MKERQNVAVYFAVVILLFSSSCRKDWFEIKSDTNITVLHTLQDFEMLLDDFEIMSINSPAIGEVASDGHFVPDNRWVAFTGDLPVLSVQRIAYTWTKHKLITELRDWNMPHRIIFNCNLVLEGLRRIKRDESNRQQYDRVYGNALFHRARMYYELAQVFTLPYDPSKDSEYGMPFKERTDLSEKLTRKSVHDTYDKIEADFLKASELLPEKATSLTRGSKAACWGFLARISLVKSEYEDALTYANKVLHLNDRLIDFNNLPVGLSNLGIFNEEVIFHSRMINLHMIYLSGYCIIDPFLVDQYEENDLRKIMYFRYTPNGVMFIGMYNNSSLQFAGIATDEIYLIKSEACARTNRIGESMSVLNTLLESRYRRNVDGTTTLISRTASGETDALHLVLSERKKELLLRGIRWSDLKRLSLDARFAVTLTRTIVGETYVLPPGSPKYAFPIPDDEISFSRIPQNPGWD